MLSINYTSVRLTYNILCDEIFVLLVFSVWCFIDRFCPFSFDHCIVCPYLIYGLWLTLWYLQTYFVIQVCKKQNLNTFIHFITQNVICQANGCVVMLIDYQVINFIYDINNCSNDNESVHQFYKWLPFPTDSVVLAGP
jgi:hypothetical protein